ncbi:transglycosylase SLT domain-containing protein [Acinetobacter silvestris]|uniref:ABC transporter substrate-binding protein n=1 Tax=Acinetobacter silvestris TaxID=1977882 RepID=A0A1Y3CHT3_9GAMM|nr:transglycosylase SLT domain-containing protein [Acinetobacter silvestris]OTG65462.1 ABC transporter substrate-binding protein [Acinetobacter silvestris]
MRSSSLSGSRRCLNSIFNSLPLKTLILSTALIPFYSINASKTNQYNAVVNSSKLTVVAVANPSIVFKDGQYKHGFAYDLVNDYAQNLNVKLDFKTVPDNATALKMVAQGQANFAITTATMQTVEAKQLTSFSATCGDFTSLKKNGLNTELNWVFKHADDPLTATASGFVCQSKQNGTIQQLASFYNRNVVKKDDWNIIQRDLSNRMPIYQASFKKTAQQYNLDWHFLAAMGYQESYLKPDSVSPTGVRGIMMLTNQTAKAMGVSNRTDPAQSIQGGAKYFDMMLSRYSHIPNPDRHWFALVAYNMGPGAVDGVQKRIKAQGKDPNNWINFYEYLTRNQAQNGRYKQAIHYVTRIRAYLEHIKSDPKLLEI